MLITKESFITYLNEYKRAFEEQKKFQEALRPFFDFPVCTYLDSLFRAYEELLVEVSECADEDGIFNWWLTESPNDNKVITIKSNDGIKKSYDVTSTEGLYTYLYDMYHLNRGGDTNELSS